MRTARSYRARERQIGAFVAGAGGLAVFVLSRFDAFSNLPPASVIATIVIGGILACVLAQPRLSVAGLAVIAPWAVFVIVRAEVAHNTCPGLTIASFVTSVSALATCGGFILGLVAFYLRPSGATAIAPVALALALGLGVAATAFETNAPWWVWHQIGSPYLSPAGAAGLCGAEASSES